MFPLFSLVGKVLEHMAMCRATGIVILPLWPAQAWCHMEVNFATDVVPLLLLPGVFVGVDGSPKQFKWRMLALFFNFSFHRQLQVEGTRWPNSSHSPGISFKEYLVLVQRTRARLYAMVCAGGAW